MKYIQYLLIFTFLACFSLQGFANEEKIKDEMLICTMEYAPVCGEDGVTYGNSCSAGNTPIVYEGECKTIKSYTYSEDFLQAEGNTCKIATDGCNTVHIRDGKLGAMTRMYCEDIYGKKGKEQWSCLDESLEDKRVGFLSENDKNQYYVFQDHLGEDISIQIESAVSDFGNKILEKTSYNLEDALLIIDRAISSFEKVIFNLIMTYPADVGMSDMDTQKYYILTIAKFELKIMKQRWLNNSK